MQGLYEPPFQVDKYEYPFTNNWFERNGTILHYIDEGCGHPVLFLHGNRSWSYLYRKIIPGLSGDCRCIAPDYPGFGFSSHPSGYRYTPMEQAEWISALVDYLNLDNIILVAQDWGGPIGLSLAINQPHRFSGLILSNTWCRLRVKPPGLFSRLLGGRNKKSLNGYTHIFRTFSLLIALSHDKHRSKEKTGQTKKSPSKNSPSQGLDELYHHYGRTLSWMKAMEDRLNLLYHLPVEMIWAMNDSAFGKEAFINKWLEHFPQASVEKISVDGYVHESRPDLIRSAVNRLLTAKGNVLKKHTASAEQVA